MAQKKRARGGGNPIKGGSSDAQKSYEQRVWSQLRSMEKDVAQLGQAVDEMKVSLMNFRKDTVQGIVTEIMKQFRPEEIAKEPKRCRKSNNGGPGGPKAQPRETRKSKANTEAEKNEPFILLSSDCSVTPSSPAKAKRSDVKEKRKRPSVAAPRRFHRALRFNEAHRTEAGPFLVDSNFPEEDINLLKYIFMKRHSKDFFSNMTVARADDTHVTRTEVQCLGPRELICSGIINLFGSYMNEETHVNWYLKTLFGSLSIGVKNPGMSTEAWLDYVKNLASLEQFEGRVEQCERIFIPMLEKLGIAEIGHWYLVVVHPKEGYVKLLDSAPGRTEARQKDARAAMCMLDNIFFNNLDAPPKLGNFPFRGLEDTGPIQPHCSNDCGLFVIRNMERYGSNWAANYNSYEARARLVIDCLRHEKNKVRDLQVSVDRALLRWSENEDNQRHATIEISDD